MNIEKTEKRLMNKAVHYLGRYSASEQRLREVLGRFAKRKLADTDPTEVASATNSVVQKCLHLGYVDDLAFAISQVSRQRQQGKSSRIIRQKLLQHKVDDAAIAAAIHKVDVNHNDAELAAAIKFARRRQLGQFYRGVVGEKTYHKHIGSLARAGFSISTCRLVLNSNSIHDLEKLERDTIQVRQEDG